MPKIYDTKADVEFLENPDNWPNWPVCPVKRPGKDGGWPEHAVVHEVALAGLRFQLTHGNLFADRTGNPSECFRSAQEIVDAGWRVD